MTAIAKQEVEKTTPVIRAVSNTKVRSKVILIGIVTIGFKATGNWLKKNKYATIFYLLLGAFCIVLFLPPFIFDRSEITSGSVPRLHIDTSNDSDVNQLFFIASYFSIVVVFLIFYAFNFPVRVIKTALK